METFLEVLDRRRSLAHVSEKPWGEFTAADYTPEQWHKACLIHLHDGGPGSKSQCKLPVRTPDGIVSRPGVHAAAGALAGARGGVDASDEEKKRAAKALVRLYGTLNEDPPESLVEHSDFSNEELIHYGVPGMRWGRRKNRDTSPTEVSTSHTPGQRIKTSGGARQPAHEDAIRTASTRQKAKASTIDALSNNELKALVNRMNMERQYAQLAAEMTPRTRGQRFVNGLMSMLGTSGKNYAQQAMNDQFKAQMDQALGINAKKERESNARKDRDAAADKARRDQYK